ncbi:hypothetical protein PF004_g31472 [Phytophthora fragariae]|uniref:Uncharacterized protein n=1 Tax=Phytophthora fragariae TaxID=53985 RepID=A0A6G0M9N0_9STRA|nr:hypothetical protein PF004_g31472 [Phytophthora fragariae]
MSGFKRGGASCVEKPGKTKQDQRGVDFFVGEKELMGYLDRVDLEEMRKQVAKSSKPPRRLLRDRMRKPLERLRQTRVR